MASAESSTQTPATVGRFRGDIQGLRAVAVFSVIADHLFGWPRGGFVGVDVFFVISGFLITDLLVREYARSGRVSFRGFYLRRVKRLLPAAALVTLATLTVSWFVMGNSRFEQTLQDAGWSAVFAANWRFATVGTDYFQADGPASPFQHFWSLSVEEQFYLVWPALLVFLTIAATRLRLRRLVLAATLTVAIASFAWACVETASSPLFAYFSTATRAWELAAGAALALAAPSLGRVPQRARSALAWLGLLGLAASVLVITPTSAFPGPTAALPVLSTVLIVAAGIGRTGPGPGLLDNRIARYLGDISYSLYLWHWPVIVLGTTIVVRVGVVQELIFALVIAATATLSYHLVEAPLRSVSWRRRTTPNPDSPKTRRRRLLLLSGAMITATAIWAGISTGSWHNWSAMAQEPLQLPNDTGPELAALQEELWAATTVAQWPDDLNPTIDEAIEGGQAPPDIASCGMKFDVVALDKCRWGEADAPRIAMVMGDSTSMGYVAGIRQIVESNPEWQVLSYGTFGCFYGDFPDRTDSAECAERKQSAADAVARLKPDVVFITNHYGQLTGSSGAISPEARAQAVASFASRWGDAAGEVVVISPPPAMVSMAECYTRLSIPADCTNAVTERWQQNAQAEGAMADQTGAIFVDSRLWFCTQGNCPPFVGTIPTRRDYNHATPEYQERIGPAMLEELVARGVF